MLSTRRGSALRISRVWLERGFCELSETAVPLLHLILSRRERRTTSGRQAARRRSDPRETEDLLQRDRSRTAESGSFGGRALQEEGTAQGDSGGWRGGGKLISLVVV